MSPTFLQKITENHTMILQKSLMTKPRCSSTRPAPPSRNLLDLEEFHYEHNFAWEDETRGLQEIMSAMDELFEKVWYNLHI